MKISKLVSDTQKKFASIPDSVDAHDVVKFLNECSELMNDCGWAYSQELKNDNLVFAYALERCVEKLKLLIEWVTNNYLDTTGNYIALLNAMKEHSLLASRSQIEIWLREHTELDEETIFGLVWVG